MKIKDTENIWGITVEKLCEDALIFRYGENEMAIDREQAAELLPILEHFVKTGELPE